VIGGLIAGTVVTLVLVPLIYLTLESFMAKVFSIFGSPAGTPASQEVVEA